MKIATPNERTAIEIEENAERLMKRTRHVTFILCADMKLDKWSDSNMLKVVPVADWNISRRTEAI